VALGGVVADADELQTRCLDGYSKAMGLAFQVVDDILDVTADSVQLGKTPGKDAAANKPTYVGLMGLEQAESFALDLHRRALESLAPLGDSAILLQGMADYIVLRKN